MRRQPRYDHYNGRRSEGIRQRFDREVQRNELTSSSLIIDLFEAFRID